jgi:hypothetical protein
MNSKKTILSDKKINVLFEKYSDPMLNACITEFQKEKAIGISKILWLFLVTGKDTEENIYIGLKSILHHHDEVISLGSLYFHKMKKALTKKELQLLKKHYDNLENLNSLTDWGNINLVKDLH